MILDAVAYLLIAFAAINLLATYVLVRAALRHRWAALEERATVAVVLTVAAVAAAVVGLGRLRILDLPSEASLGLIAIGLILLSIPNIIWALAYWTGRFDEADSSGHVGRP